MHSFSRSIILRSSMEEVFLFHTKVENLIRITPKYIKVKILKADSPGPGQQVHLLVQQLGFISMKMLMEFFVYEYPTCLADKQLKGPFKTMVQYRYFEDMGGGYTRMKDVFEYALPLGVLGKFAHKLFLGKLIESMFVHRQNMTKKLLEQ